jgi:hypothetical protein
VGWIGFWKETLLDQERKCYIRRYKKEMQSQQMMELLLPMREDMRASGEEMREERKGRTFRLFGTNNLENGAVSRYLGNT